MLIILTSLLRLITIQLSNRVLADLNEVLEEVFKGRLQQRDSYKEDKRKVREEVIALLSARINEVLIRPLFVISH